MSTSHPTPGSHDSSPSDAPARIDDLTPLDGDDFLSQNRENRARIRDAERKAERRARRGDARSAGDADELTAPTDDERDAVQGPGRVATPRRFTVGGSRAVMVALVALTVGVVGLAATTGYFVSTTMRARSELAAAGVSTDYRQQAMDAARRYAVELTTYDPADYSDLDRRIRAISTPAFAERYITSSRDARQGNAAVRGISRSESKEAGVQAISSDRAVVLVTLDQTVTSPEIAKDVPEGIPYQSRIKLTLVHRDGRWQLDDLAAV